VKISKHTGSRLIQAQSSLRIILLVGGGIIVRSSYAINHPVYGRGQHCRHPISYPVVYYRYHTDYSDLGSTESDKEFCFVLLIIGVIIGIYYLGRYLLKKLRSGP
jgi:hypothetical protein